MFYYIMIFLPLSDQISSGFLFAFSIGFLNAVIVIFPELSFRGIAHANLV